MKDWIVWVVLGVCALAFGWAIEANSEELSCWRPPAGYSAVARSADDVSYVNKKVLTGYGVPDYVEFITNEFDGTETLEITGKLILQQANHNYSAYFALDDAGGANNIYWRHTTNSRIVSCGGVDHTWGVDLLPGDEIQFNLTYKPADGEYFIAEIVNGSYTKVATIPCGTVGLDGSGFFGRMDFASSYFLGQFVNFRIRVNWQTVLEYGFCEGAGSTVYDLSGNGNHGIIHASSGTATMWSGDSDSDFVSTHLLDRGFNYSGGVYLAGSDTAGQDVLGNPLTHQPVGSTYIHNGSPTDISFNGKEKNHDALINNLGEIRGVKTTNSMVKEVYDYGTTPTGVFADRVDRVFGRELAQ